MFVLDTNVISELRRPKPHGAVVGWLQAQSNASLCIAAITAGEVQSGIELTRKTDPEKAGEIERWLDELISSIRVLDASAPIFRSWSRLMHGRPDHHWEDALIAATALHHRMTIVSRNESDFRSLGVEVLNPFGYPGA